MTQPNDKSHDALSSDPRFAALPSQQEMDLEDLGAQDNQGLLAWIHGFARPSSAVHGGDALAPYFEWDRA